MEDREFQNTYELFADETSLFLLLFPSLVRTFIPALKHLISQLNIVIDGSKQGSDDGPIEQAKFDAVGALTVSADGIVYFIDQKGHAIRSLNQGHVSTVLSKPEPTAFFYSIASNSHQKLLAYSDVGCFRAGIISRDRSVVLHQVGSGVPGSNNGHVMDATLPDMFSVTFMPSTGDLLIAEMRIIRRWNVRTRTISHFAGKITMNDNVNDNDQSAPHQPKSRTEGDGPAENAVFSYINDIICDEKGNVYVADGARIRRISNGFVETLAGSHEVNYRDGPAEAAAFEGVICLTLGKDGALYACDGGLRIRKIFRGHVSTLHMSAPPNLAPLHLTNIFSISMNLNDGYLYITNSGSIFRVAVERPPPPDVLLGRGHLTTTEIIVQGNSIPLHKEFIELRCPMLLKDQTPLERVPSPIALLFVEFLYSGKIPDCMFSSLQLGVRTLCDSKRPSLYGSDFLSLDQFALHKFGFKSACVECLNMFRSIVLDEERFMPAVELFKSIFRLGWAAGERAAGFLLQKHKKVLNMKQVTEFMKDDLDALANLMQLLLSDPTAEQDFPEPESLLSPQDPRKRQLMPKSLAQSLKELFKSKKGADFEIALRGGSSAGTLKCHSFVLYSRWPYFRRLVDSGMKEAQEKRLLLPGPEEPAGWDFRMLVAVVEVIYCGKTSPSVLAEIDATAAVRIHGLADLFLVAENESHLTSPFADLLKHCKDKIVSGISLENCIDIYRAASQVNAEEIINIAKQFIVDALPEFGADPERANELMKLPWESQLALLWYQIGRRDAPPCLVTLSAQARLPSPAQKREDDSDGCDIQITDDIAEPARKRRKLNSTDAGGE